ncbi:hypothetical protein PVAND_013177 [Polypedilum vanderplanki]|uniref:ABC transporter domain-containing protein n=1 Tax=Polypedilum vanderplanki TaxID=319348 RepID=A0A9J6CPW2_POLVA|nr:hypothetical protein PVAND_013177 [Polypedilum vanderplanki]
MTTSAWDKFLLLSWKNWLIQIRHPIQTVLEVMIPILVCAFLILIRGLVDVSEETEALKFPPIVTNEFVERNFTYQRVIAYSPNNPVLNQIVKNAADQIFNFSHISFSNQTELEGNALTASPFVSIEFDQSLANLQSIKDFPNNIHYALRFPAELRTENEILNEMGGFTSNWATNIRFGLDFLPGPRNGNEFDGGEPPGYIRQGFIFIQNLIDREIIRAKIGNRSFQFPDLYIQRMPFPEYVTDVLGLVMEFAIPLIFLVAFMVSAINNIKYIAIERELQLKEAMKIMGLPGYMHWIAWFTKCMIFQIVIISVITGLVKIPFESKGGLSVFTHTEWSVLWVFFFLYAMAGVTFSFMFSTFFAKANTCSIVGAIVWLMMLQPYSIMNMNYSNIGLGPKLGASLLVNTGMGFGFKVLGRYESALIGVNWNNLFQPVTPDDDLTLGYIMLVLLAASVLQMLIALYVEKIKPGEYGVPEKWYFPLSPSFWCGGKATSNSEIPDMPKHNPNYESEPVGKNAGIKIRGLRKTYNNKVAVEGLNLNIYEDQITILLGHNGAGKSTTMSMLTGLFPPTSGTAYINGHDIRSDLNSVRGSLGLCPQHNVLFNELTVREHIIFFTKLKGIKDKQEIEQEIRKYVNLLGLGPKMNAQSKTLSGGMKRKLSIGIALCGDSKIVMCDEPSSGMDPGARRALWDILIQEKKGRTILLTTHFMEEAEVLGDRIVIMAEGKLKTVGSQYFLKKRFGVGYRLICVKKPTCNPQVVTNFLSKYIPEIVIETNIGTELTYVLNQSYVRKFKMIFKDLEDNQETLKILSFGLSLTTMEEVFLKVGIDSNTLDVEERYEGISNGSSNGSNDALKLINTNLTYGICLYFNQILAMAMKKFFYMIRNYMMLFIQFFIPALFIVITMLMEDLFDGDQDLPELQISFREYIRTITTYEIAGNQNIFASYKAFFDDLPDEHVLRTTEENLNLEDTILKEYRLSLSNVNLNYMVGTTFNESSITAWFNNQAFHTAPLTINLINNAILKSLTGNLSTISISNKPLPFSLNTRLIQLQAGNNLGFNIALNTGFSMALATSLFVMFYIKERVTKAKLLQIVSGVNKFIFWLVAFVIDYAIFFLIALVYIGVLAAYQKEGLATFEELGRNSIILLLFGFAVLPFTYMISFGFRVPTTGLVVLAIGFIVSGTLFYTVYFVLISDFLDLRWIAEPLGWTFLIFPHFSLTQGLSNINVKQSTLSTCDRQCATVSFCNIEMICESDILRCGEELPIDMPNREFFCNLQRNCCNRNFYTFEETGIGRAIVALIVVGIASFIVLFILEYKLIQMIINRCRKTKVLKNIPESEENFIDADVLAEKDKIRMYTQYLVAKNNLVMKNFTKFYGNFMAVNQLCVGVDRAECFGLLGVNGAGKTSAFKMLVGDESISAGDAWVDGFSIRTQLNKVHKRIGYCPQFDALIEDLTGRETLKIFALLRGISRDSINQIAEQLAEDLNFTKHLDKKTKEYSGGNKRKLSTALTLIGDPSVIYLDEPTSGMDVGARRQLWNMVIKARNSGKSIVLTSHSMEECEVLCNRLAIMVNGEFKCLGSVQHLKNKFSKGFFLTIKIGNNDDVHMLNRKIIVVKDFVANTFSGAILKEEFMDLLSYHIPTEQLKWSNIFGIMEDAKQKLGISDYSLGQTSLEQVFLYFTKTQRISDKKDK